MQMHRVVFLLGVIFWSLKANAFCFDEAGARYNVDPYLLKAMAQVESSLRPSVINRSNGNGSEDYGLMQINSSWLPKLKQYHITKDKLLNDPCLNVNVGAWLLSLNFLSHGYNWNSVGAYNAGFSASKKKQRRVYENLVRQKLSKLL